MPVVFRSARGSGAQRRHILCYGDSLTAGFCDQGRSFEPYGRSLSDSLSSLGCDCEVSVCGHSGHTAGEMVRNLDAPLVGPDSAGLYGKGLKRILAECAEAEGSTGELDLVIIMAGTNDLGLEMKPHAIFEDICRLHAACLTSGVPSVVIAPPPVPRASARASAAARLQLLELMSTWARSEAATGIAAFIDPAVAAPLLVGNAAAVWGAVPLWDPDRLHLSPGGSRLLGERIASLVAPLLRC